MAEAATDTGSSAGNAVMACCSGAVKCGRKVCGCITDRIKKLNVRTVSIMLRVINLANAVFLAVASFYAYKDLANTVTRFFLATYIGVFALLLCLFETRVPWTENIIRRNFGFMFTYTGRAVFLIFLGAISFGMIDSSNGAGSTIGFNVVVGAGIATLLNSILNCFIICSHPGFQELSKQAEESFAGTAGAAGAGKDPSRMTEEQVRAYLALHPELAAQALSAGVGAAADSSQPHAGAASSVPEWGATATAAAAPAPAAAKESSGGWFGRGKPKAGKAAASPDAEAGGYAPPAVPAASAPAKPLDAADSDNPFGGSSSSSSVPSAPAPAAPAVTAAAPAAPASVSPRPAAAVTAAAPAPAAAAAPRPPADLEDNPFAQDNPFDKDGGF